MRRILLAFRNSWHGLLAIGRRETAFQQELVLLLIAVPLALVVALDAWRWLALVGVVLLVLIVEILNTALEKLSDHVTPETHPAIGFVKDVGSLAVAIALLLAGLVWLVAFAERLGLV